MRNLKIAALITCRGKNTLTKKHLRYINGKRLIEYSFVQVKNSNLFDKKYLSTDDEKILRLATKYDIESIKRPASISKPTSQHIDAIEHALDYMKKKDNFIPDILVVILGNTVYIKKEWIEKSIKKLIKNKNISSVVPVYLNQDHHPYRAKLTDKNGFLRNYFKEKKEISTNRQDLPKNYFLCHNFWTLRVKESIIKKSKGDPPWKFMGNKVAPLVLEGHLDVHEKEDLKLSKAWLKKERNQSGGRL